MNLFLTIVAIIIVIMFSYSQVLKYKRYKHSTHLKSAYNKMEMFFTSKNIPITKNYLELLKTFKQLSVNSEYLDIQILLPSKIAAQKSGQLKKDTKWFEKSVESLGDDFKIILNDFDNSANRLIMLSFWKPDFVFFVIKLFFKYAFKSGIYSIGKFMSEVAFIKNNDEAIFYSAKKLAV